MRKLPFFLLRAPLVLRKCLSFFSLRDWKEILSPFPYRLFSAAARLFFLFSSFFFFYTLICTGDLSLLEIHRARITLFLHSVDLFTPLPFWPRCFFFLPRKMKDFFFFALKRTAGAFLPSSTECSHSFCGSSFPFWVFTGRWRSQISPLLIYGGDFYFFLPLDIKEFFFWSKVFSPFPPLRLCRKPLLSSFSSSFASSMELSFFHKLQRP